MTRYLNGRFTADDDSRVSSDDRGFLFGDGAYEVVPCYAGKPFGMGAHIERFRRSLGELRIEPPDLESVPTIALELLRRNDLEGSDALLYVQCTRGAACPRTHTFPSPSVEPTLYASVSRFDRPTGLCENGASVALLQDLRWLRCDIKSLNLLANVLARQQAKETGAAEAVLVRDGYVTEGSHSNVFAVFDGTLRTHPRSNLILSGITRATVIELAGGVDLPVLEKAIPLEDLLSADELFLAGTTVEVMPVVRVDSSAIGDGSPGKLTRKLQQAYWETIGVF